MYHARRMKQLLRFFNDLKKFNVSDLNFLALLIMPPQNMECEIHVFIFYICLIFNQFNIKYIFHCCLHPVPDLGQMRPCAS